MAELKKGSQITARFDSNVNVLDYPRYNGKVVATFEPFAVVGYAATDEIFFDETSKNDPTTYVKVIYFTKTPLVLPGLFLPLGVGYVDQDSIAITDPAPIDTDAPVQDENGNKLPESERENGITVPDPKTGEKVVVVPNETSSAVSSAKGKTMSSFPTWAKAVIIGVASVIVIVSGVWIYQQFKKPTKK